MQYSLFTAHRPSPSLASSQPSSLVSRLGSTEDLYCDDELRSLATSDPVNMRLLDPGLAIQPGDSAWPGTEPGDDGGLGSYLDGLCQSVGCDRSVLCYMLHAVATEPEQCHLPCVPCCNLAHYNTLHTGKC